MSAWDDKPEPEHDVTDIETARLALRGALQSARSLQDLNAKLKGELQDFLHREKALNERLVRLQTELNDTYSRLDQETASERDRITVVRETLRQEIIAEQNHKWQTEIDALRQSVQNWTEVRRQKEHELKLLKEALLSKEQEVFTLQRDKIAAEEKAHRDVLDAIKNSRAGVSTAIDDIIQTKEKEIADLQRKLAAQPKVIEERLQQVEQELHRKEQSLLLQFRDRQQALEFDWARREKELWEKATESREALERDLKNQWEERRRNLEESVEKRRTTLEIQSRQQEEEQQRRMRVRNEELHQTWAAKEASLAQEWAERENELAREFQKTLDVERQRASDEIVRLKADMDAWRKGQEETYLRKETDFNKAHEDAERQLRIAYRKKEEDLLARHQEALTAAQHQISDLMTRTSEKEGFAKVAGERLAAALKDRDQLAEKFERLEADAMRRTLELEAMVKARDEELARLTQSTTTRDEERIARIQILERDQMLKDSDLKVLREKIQQAETDRKASLDHAVALETEFTQRQQQLEEAFRGETETLREKLTSLSHSSSERQQTDQRLLAELEATVKSRQADIQGLTHQLQLARHDIEKLTQESADKQAKGLLIRRQLEEQLGAREAELNKQIATLEKERMLIEERLDARIVELEQELSRRLSEDKALQDRYRQSEEFRVDLEKQADILRDRLAAHERQNLAREDEVRKAREAAELERITAEQKLQLRIGELENTIARQQAAATELQEEFQRTQDNRLSDQQEFSARETRLEMQASTLQQQLKTQDEEMRARLTAVQLEHDRVETALRQQMQTQDAAQIKAREELITRVTELEGDLRRRDLDIKGLQDQMIQDERTRRDQVRDANQREATLEERVQFLSKTVESQKQEFETQFSTAEHAHRKEADVLRAQLLRMETDFGRKSMEADDLTARLDAAQTRQGELTALVTQLEARVLDKEQVIRAAAQTHLNAEQKLNASLTDMQASVEKRTAELQAAEKRIQDLTKERQAETRAAAEREKALEERLAAMDEKLRTQKEQITLRLTGVERQRLQSEEALYTRTLDLEQRLAEKSSLVKNLQDQLTHTETEQEHLTKKITSLESHLSRAEQQLKGRETEYQSLLSTSQKDIATVHETHQHKLLELQGQRLKLETDMKHIQDVLVATEQEKVRQAEKIKMLEAHAAQESEAARSAYDATKKEAAERLAAEVKTAQGLQIQISDLESRLMRKEAAFAALEQELAKARSDYDHLAATTTEAQRRLSEQQAQLEARLRDETLAHQKHQDALLQERMSVEKAHQARILELEEQVAARTRELQAIETRLGSSEGQRTDRDRQAAVLQKEIRDLQLAMTAQQEEFRGRMAGFEKERVQLQETQQNRITHLESQLNQRESALRTLQEKMTQSDADRQAAAKSTADLEMALASQKKDMEGRLEQVLNDRVKTETELHARVTQLQETLTLREKDLVLLKETLRQADQARGMAEAASQDAVSAAAKERQSLEERLVQEIGHVRDLESQLRGHAAHIKEANKALDAGEKERAALQVSLTELRERLDDEIGVREAMTQEQVQALEGKMRTIDAEWRERLDDSIKTSTVRIEALQTNVVQLEGALAVRDNDLMAIRQRAAELDLERERLVDVVAQKDRERETLAATADRDKKVLTAQLANLQAERKAAEEALHAQLNVLRDTLERQLSAEQKRSEGLDTQVNAQVSELKQLRALLAEVQGERERLIQTLSAEREKGVTDSDAFRQRLTAVEREATARLDAVQARANDLEKALAQQKLDAEQQAAQLKASLTNDFNLRLNALQSDHVSAEKDLHAKLVNLRDTLAARVVEIQTLTLRLRDTEQERAALEQLSSASHAETSKRQEELEREITAERSRAQALETQCTAQVSELKQLQSILQGLRAEREELLNVLAAEREKAAGELKGRQKAAAEMEAALRIRFEAQLKESAQRFDALQARAMELERQAADKQAAVDRLQEALKETEARRAQLEAQWSAEARDRRALQEEVAKATKEWQAAENDLQARLLAVRDELDQRLNTERERNQALDTQVAAQLSELKQLRTSLAEARTERDHLLKTLSAERDSATTHSTSQDKEFRQRLAAVEAESAQRLAQLQARTHDLEKALGAQKADFEQRERDLTVRLNDDFARQLAAIAAERKTVEDALHARLLEARQTIDVRVADIQKMAQQLKETEQARAALEQFSNMSHADATQRREALEAQLQAERERSQALDTQLTTQVSELKRLQGALDDVRAERERLLATLAAEREKAAAALKGQEKITVDREAAVRDQMEAQDVAFRARLAAADQEAARRMTALQARTAELEKGLAAQRADFEQRLALAQNERAMSEKALQAKVSELHAQWVARSAEFEAVQQQLATAQKERDALSAAAVDQKDAFAEQLKALRERAIDLERQAGEKQAALTRLQDTLKDIEAQRANAEAQWALETQQRRAAQEAAAQAQDAFNQRVMAIEAERKAAEDALRQRLLQVRDDLDQRLNAEREKNHSLHAEWTAQVSELKQLRASLEETRAEREQLLKALAAEREKSTHDLKDRDTTTAEQKHAFEQRLAAQEKDFRERLTAIEAESARKVLNLQARANELEKSLAAQHSDYEKQLAAQRSEYEQRLAVWQADRAKSEKTLQSSIADLETQLTVRGKELDGLNDRLAIADAQRQEWEQSLSTQGAEWIRERKAFEARLSEERARAHALDLDVKALSTQCQELKDALAAAGKDNAALSTRFNTLEKDSRERLEKAVQDATVRMQALQTRALELERQDADKDAAVDRLRDALKELETKRAHMEAQWTLEVEARRAAQEMAAQDKTNFTQRLTAIEAERKAAEDGLHNQLLELRDTLAARTAAVQNLERQLKETEQARAALEHYSTASHTEMTQAQNALANQFQAEQERAKALDNRVAAQVAELKQLRQSLADARTEREQLLAQIAGEREKAALALKTSEKASAEEAAAFRQKTEALEREFRERLAVVNAETARRLSLVQARAAELEKALSAQRAEHEQRLATLQAAMQAERKATEDALQKRIAELRDTLSARGIDLQQLEQRLLDADQARIALEQSTSAALAEAVRQRQDLEQRLSEERTRARDLDLSLKANAALIKDLKDALATEQGQYKASVERSAAQDQRIDEARRRVADLEAQMADKQSALHQAQNKLADLDAKYTQAERQRTDLAARLTDLQAERKAMEEDLHQRLVTLRDQLERRVRDEQEHARGLDQQVAAHVAELKQLRGALADEKAERERLSAALSAEREKALLELKSREKSSAETQSSLWQQMEAQEKEFRAQMAAIEEEAARRVSLLQTRTADLEKTLAAQRSEFEQRLTALQHERAASEEKLHAKIFSLEETLSRRIAEAQKLHAEFAAVETARSVAEESVTTAHAELIRQQAAFDERLAQEQAQARALEQQLQQHKAQAREWKDALTAAKEERRALDAAWQAEKQKIFDDLRHHGAAAEAVQVEHDRRMAVLQQEWTVRLETLSKDSAERLKVLQGRVSEMERELAGRVREATELRDRMASLDEERTRLQAAVSHEEEAKRVANERSADLEARMADVQRTHLQNEQKMHVRIVDLEDQLNRKSAGLNQLEDQLELLQNANTEFEKSAARDNAAWARQREELEKRLSVERGRLRDLEAEQTAQQTTLRDLRDALSLAEKERQQALEALKAQKERFLADLSQRDAGSAQRQRALEAEREALERQWQDRLKLAGQDQTARMDDLRHRADDLEKQVGLRMSELRQLRDQISGLEQERRDFQEQVERLHRDRKEQAEAAAAERARLVERARALEERLQQQTHDLSAQLEDDLDAERSRAKDVSRQLADAQRQLKEAREALAEAEHRQAPSAQSGANVERIQEKVRSLERQLRDRSEAFDAEVEKRVAEKLREQMMGALESGLIKGGDTSAMQALLEEWVFGFAHQVRNPLGIIRSVAESLYEGEARRSQRDSLSAIVKAVDGLNLRLKEFIEFSKPVKPLTQSVDLPSAVSAAVKMVEEKMATNVRIQASLPAQGTRVWIDPDHLRTMLVHLLRNAGESMPKGGTVRLAVNYEASHERLELRVEDEGAGIPREHLKEVGRPFFSTKPGAVGLGLALIKRLLRAYEGKMDIDSRAGHTTVTCRMKVRQESAGQWAA